MHATPLHGAGSHRRAVALLIKENLLVTAEAFSQHQTGSVDGDSHPFLGSALSFLDLNLVGVRGGLCISALRAALATTLAAARPDEAGGKAQGKDCDDDDDHHHIAGRHLLEGDGCSHCNTR